MKFVSSLKSNKQFSRKLLLCSQFICAVSKLGSLNTVACSALRLMTVDFSPPVSEYRTHSRVPPPLNLIHSHFPRIYLNIILLSSGTLG
jgi:hypothetical protein